MDLWNAYDTNSIQADDKYTNKRVKITNLVFGNFSSKLYRDGDQHYLGIAVAQPPFVTGKNEADLRKQISLLPPKQQKWMNEGVPAGVRCYIGNDSKKQFGELKPGAQFSVVGTCSGTKKDVDAYKDFVVIIKDCATKN